MVVLDEAHERSTSLDVSMGLLKGHSQEEEGVEGENNECHNTERLCEFFGCPFL